MPQEEIQKQFGQSQEKYVYCLIALCVAAIGFSIHKSTGTPLKWIQIPLGLAIIFWSGSVYFGLKFIRYCIAVLWKNNAYLDVSKGVSAVTGKDPVKIEIAASVLTESIYDVGKKAEKMFKYQTYCIYVGFVLFMAWHVLEMYSRTTFAPCGN